MEKEIYVKPEISIASVELESVIASSYGHVGLVEDFTQDKNPEGYKKPICDSKKPICDSMCSIWHICRDRQSGTVCCDKKSICDYERREKEKRQEEDDRIFQEYLDAKELEKKPVTEEQKKCDHAWYQHWTWHSGGWQECRKCGRIETFYERD